MQYHYFLSGRFNPISFFPKFFWWGLAAVKLYFVAFNLTVVELLEDRRHDLASYRNETFFILHFNQSNIVLVQFARLQKIPHHIDLVDFVLATQRDVKCSIRCIGWEGVRFVEYDFFGIRWEIREIIVRFEH